MEKPKSQAEKTTKTTVDTIGFTREEAAAWPLAPGIQRPLKINKKVKEKISSPFTIFFFQIKENASIFEIAGSFFPGSLFQF